MVKPIHPRMLEVLKWIKVTLDSEEYAEGLVKLKESDKELEIRDSMNFKSEQQLLAKPPSSL